MTTTNLAVVALRTALRGLAGDPSATREEADKLRLEQAMEAAADDSRAAKEQAHED